eukprot:2336076-Amphidinium_carterae.1
MGLYVYFHSIVSSCLRLLRVLCSAAGMPSVGPCSGSRCTQRERICYIMQLLKMGRLEQDCTSNQRIIFESCAGPSPCLAEGRAGVSEQTLSVYRAIKPLVLTQRIVLRTTM